MVRKVVVTDIAKTKLSNLLDFLLKNWSYKTKSNFVEILNSKIEIIRLSPEIYPQSKYDTGLRRCVITKHNTLYYRYNEKEITILTIFDTRQHPNKLKGDLE